ncbi:MAG TPA: hypothetical protein VFZ46_06665 [Nitrososphaeraceae archaeon]
MLLSIVFVASFYLISNTIHERYSSWVMAQLEPITTIEKVSENGHYLVQFKSGMGPTTPEIPIDIVFLNATFPTTGREGTVFSSPETIEGGDTELAEDPELSIPVDYNLAPVQRYDLTIYDDQGNTLWHKANNDLYGISGKNFITLGDYVGNITIFINNISMSPSVEKTILERQSSSGEATIDKTLKDSVKFNVFVDSDKVIKADPSKTEFTIRPD